MNRSPKSHHAKLKDRALAEGWYSGGFFDALKEIAGQHTGPEWEGLTYDLGETIEAIRARRFIPDAWRLGTFSSATDPTERPVIVFDFLEVEVTHHISVGKAEMYVSLFNAVTGSPFFHMRVYVMNQFGTTNLFLDSGPTWADIMGALYSPEWNLAGADEPASTEEEDE